MNGWTRVEDALPQPGQTCVVAYTGQAGEQGVWFGFHGRLSGTWMAVTGVPLHGVTHWQPAPQHPESELQ